MVNWQDPILVARLGAAQQAVLFFCTGVIFYDQLCLLSFDWNLLKAHRRRKLPLIAYFGAKFSWWVYAVVCIISILGVGPYNCMGIIRSIEFFMACIAVCSSGLLAIRTVCVWQNEKAKRIVAWSVGVFGVVLAGVWFAGVADITAMWVPNGGAAFQKGACAPVKVEMRYFVKYIITILFDLFVLVLTVAGVFRMSSNGRTHIGALLVQQGLFYFLATFVANLVPAIFTMLQLSPYISLYFAVPSSFVAVLASTRLYVQLAREATSQGGSQGRHHGNHVPYSNHTGSSVSDKLSAFMRRKSTATPQGGAAFPPSSPSTAVGTGLRRKQAPQFYASAHHDDSLDIGSGSFPGSASDLEKQNSHGSLRNENEVGLDSSLAHGVTTGSEADAPTLPNVAPFVAALDMHSHSPESTLHGHGGYPATNNNVAPALPAQAAARRQQIPHPFSAAAQGTRGPRVVEQAQSQQQQQQQQAGGRNGRGVLTGIIVEQTREESLSE